MLHNTYWVRHENRLALRQSLATTARSAADSDKGWLHRGLLHCLSSPIPYEKGTFFAQILRLIDQVQYVRTGNCALGYY